MFPGAQRDPHLGRGSTVQHRGRDARRRAAAALHDGRAVRIPAVRLAAVGSDGRPVTQKALASGVPVCVVPFGRDQLEVARRVETADAGTRLPAQKLNADRLRAQIRLAMTKHDGARRVAAGYTATGGPAAAADAFEALASARSHVPTVVESAHGDTRR